MTTERIDHVAEAREWLAGAERPDISDALATQMAAIAQVHATLALVEQQRVANLIALGSVSATTIGSAKSMADQVNEGMGW